MDLRVKQINKTFDDKVLFEDASFTFEKGKIYGLLGRNGSGKTTLFNCIAKNLSLDSGQVLIGNGDTEKEYENTDIGFVHTQPQLPAFMTAVEFIQFFMDINKKHLVEQKSPVLYLQEMGIEKEDQNRLLKDFSHGMQNKVQLLVSLMIRPPVLLLDEPLTSFDVVAAHDIKKMIRAAKSDSIIIFSTHILRLAQELCDEIVLLHQHKLTGTDSAHIHDEDFEQEIIAILSKNEVEKS